MLKPNITLFDVFTPGHGGVIATDNGPADCYDYLAKQPRPVHPIPGRLGETKKLWCPVCLHDTMQSVLMQNIDDDNSAEVWNCNECQMHTTWVK